MNKEVFEKQPYDYSWLLLISIIAMCVFISRCNISTTPSPDVPDVMGHVVIGEDTPVYQMEADIMLRHAVISGTDSVWYHYGQVIYPDYVQPDTLVVVNPRLLNEEIVLNLHKKCDGSDGDIAGLLHEGCLKLADYISYVRTGKQ